MHTLTVTQLRTLTDLIMTNDAGDAPCSRYGTPARRWAPFAAAATYVVWEESAPGMDLTDYLIGEMSSGYASPLSLVVNDSPEPATTLYEGRHLLSRGVIAELGGLRNLRSLASE